MTIVCIMVPFTVTDHALLVLLRRSLLGSHEQLKLSAAQWKAVAEASLAQALLLPALDGTEGLNDMPSKSIINTWQGAAANIRKQTQRLYQEQDRILKHFAAANLPVAILKGSSLALSYPRPELRAMKDIDLLIDARDGQAAAALMEKLGYTPERTEEAHRIGYRRGPLSVELYSAVTGLPEAASEAALRLRSLLARTVDSAEECRIQSHTFAAPVPLARSLILLLHMMSADHLRLRHLIDWGMFLHHELEDAPSRAILQTWDNCGLLPLARTLSIAAYIALDLPMQDWLVTAETDGAEQLLTAVLEHGREEKPGTNMFISTALVANVASDDKKTPAHRLFGDLPKTTAACFPAVRKCPVLYVGALPCTFVMRGIQLCKNGRLRRTSDQRKK